jgi:hypothetical protein
MKKSFELYQSGTRSLKKVRENDDSIKTDRNIFGSAREAALETRTSAEAIKPKKDTAMTKFINSEFAASKATRNERKQIARPEESSATERAVASLRRSLGKDLKKSDNKERQITKAINDTMPEFIAAMDEDVLAPFFFSLERLATSANRRRIALHPLRSDIVDEMHEEADEEDALAAEEAERAAAEEEKRNAANAAQDEKKTVKPTPQAEASDGSSSE